ncbi:MAG: hypothetical protein ABIJ56_02740 [Pseudomonadota bacterium]
MAVIACTLFLFPAGNADGLPKFTDEQIGILESGDLLKLPVNKNKSAGYSGGKSYILVKADQDTCFRIMADIKNYYFFYDDTLIEARVVSKEGNKQLIKMVYGKGPAKLTYYANYTMMKKNHTIKFKVDRSYDNDLADALGYLKFARYDDERTLMTNVTMVDLGEGLISKIFGNKITNGMLKLPKYLKKFLATPAAKKFTTAK